MTPKQIARFWAKVDKSGGPDACWLWAASRLHKGYGHVGVNGRMVNTHRVSYEMAYGAIPPKMCILHRCDNPPCCNPAHLFLGTSQDNVRDMVAKGRQFSKLTATQVQEIRTIYAAATRPGVGSRLAREYGVTGACISQIIHGKRRPRFT